GRRRAQRCPAGPGRLRTLGGAGGHQQGQVTVPDPPEQLLAAGPEAPGRGQGPSRPTHGPWAQAVSPPCASAGQPGGRDTRGVARTAPGPPGAAGAYGLCAVAVVQFASTVSKARRPDLLIRALLL